MSVTSDLLTTQYNITHLRDDCRRLVLSGLVTPWEKSFLQDMVDKSKLYEYTAKQKQKVKDIQSRIDDRIANRSRTQ